MKNLWWMLPVEGMISAAATGLLRRYAVFRGMLDIPTNRSSHTVPTPRGGGLALVATFLLGLATLASFGEVRRSTAIAVCGAGLLAVLVGFIDDHHHLAPGWRLVGHFGAVMWALTSLGRFPVVEVLGSRLKLGMAQYVFAAVYLLWLLNLYNFMDGIDGLAGIEAVTVGLGASVLWLVTEPGTTEWLPTTLLAVATLGFLSWNWPPAKIFMGDSGSCSLGIVIGVLSLDAALHEPRFFWSWLILLGVFVVDATLTLGRRVVRGEKPWEAHRTHAYQQAARQLGSHGRVTTAVGIINVMWLLPLAIVVGLGRLDGLTATLIAYLPLVGLVLLCRAGSAQEAWPESQTNRAAAITNATVPRKSTAI